MWFSVLWFDDGKRGDFINKLLAYIDKWLPKLMRWCLLKLYCYSQFIKFKLFEWTLPMLCNTIQFSRLVWLNMVLRYVSKYGVWSLYVSGLLSSFKIQILFNELEQGQLFRIRFCIFLLLKRTALRNYTKSDQ